MRYVILIPNGGGIGNLIFQYSHAYCISKKYKSNLVILYEYNENYRKNIKHYEKFFKNAIFFTNYEICKLNIGNFYEYTEPVFTYSELPDFNNFDTLFIKGYFQSWKYFYENIDSLREIFQSGNTMNEVYESVSEGKKTVCLHIRRGDYLRLREYHTVIDEDYYENSTNRFTDDEVFLVFAEDYEDDFMNWKLWSKLGKRVKFINKEYDSIDTFFLMSLCDNFIISNSTFSLAAYYLRLHDDAKLVSPNVWFGPDGPEHEISDIIFS
jgi:hypothetical protein